MAVISTTAPSRQPSLPSDPNLNPDNDSSTDFSNSSTLIPQIETLTDVGSMTRLLHECIAYQRSLDTRISSLLSHRPDLDRHLSSLLRSSHFLQQSKTDSQALLSNLDSTSSLAEHVSSKVRQLDLAQSLVEDTLLRMNAILAKSDYLENAKKSLDMKDYDSTAKMVKEFFEMDGKFPDEGSEQRDKMLDLKKRLESIVRKKLADSVDKKDHGLILRFVRIFPTIGIREDGLRIYVSYLKSVVSFRSKLELEHLKDNESDEESASGFVSCLMNLFKDIVLAVEENDEVLTDLGGEDGIVNAILILQEECDSRGTKILKRCMEFRKVSRLVSEINNTNLLSVGMLSEGLDPREVENYVEEILSLMHLGEDYTGFMISKIGQLGNVDPELCSKTIKKTEKWEL